MKHLWVLNHYAQEPSGPGGTRHFHLAARLNPLGWQTTIMAASVEHNTGRQRLGPTETLRRQHHGSTLFLWLRTPGYRTNGWRRMVNILVYTYRLLRRSTTRDLPPPDVVLGSSVHLLAPLAAFILARRYRVPFIFEVRDLWPQTLIDLGKISKGGVIARLLRLLESWLYRRASRIVVLMPQADHYIASRGIDARKVVYIPNGVELDLFPVDPPDGKAPTHSFTLMYFGAHGHNNGLDTLLEAMQLLQHSAAGAKVELKLIGDGPEKSSLMRLAQNLHLKRVTFLPAVAKESIARIAQTADAFVFPARATPVLQYGLSANKLFDYMAAQRPVIFACTSSNNPVAAASAGLSVAAQNPEQLAQAVLQLMQASPAERQRMALAGRRYVDQHHNFSRLARRLHLLLEEVTLQQPGICSP